MYSLSKTKNAADLSGDAWFDRPMPEDAAERISILPSERQVNQAETEFYAFFHYGINTYTGMEHGTGEEDPMLFNPAALDTDQWVAAIAAAGMKGAIITAKHHDGFCLWPTEYSEFSVKNSRYQGDVVAEFAKSCEKYGIKFGFYLSPFDKNAPSFGQGDAYNDYFVSQLTELMTNYGEVFEVWFDGFISDEYKGIQTYDWDRWVETVRELQPGACTAIAPPVPDVAWVGNETGLAEGNVNSVRERGGGLIWAKSECDVSIRNGWFYHEDQHPKSISKLMNIYYNSVGKNCLLLLNIPPNKEGRIDEKDVKRLEEMGKEIEAVYASPIPVNVTVWGKNGRANDTGGPGVIANDNAESYVFADNEYILEFSLESAERVKHVILSEDVSRYGERVEKFTVYAKTGKSYFKAGGAESAGGKTIVKLSRFAPKSDSYRIVVEQAKGNPVIRHVAFYK